MGGGRSRPEGIVYLALTPAAAAIGVGVLATYDPRVVVQDVYRVTWLAAAVASVLIQWGLLAFLASRPEGEAVPGLTPPDTTRCGRCSPRLPWSR